MKKWADNKRRHLDFEEGDMVIVKFFPHRFKNLKNVHKGLLRRYEGPFPIVKRIGKVAYKVEVASHLEIHPVFHVSQLKAFHEDKEDEQRKEWRNLPESEATWEKELTLWKNKDLIEAFHHEDATRASRA
ncbi:unnamed protein product [Linum trigynum]|uniref:Tf2-1-like SH3-like domain-containing protein n=1 Tax=Linum trigynum TaxID=586398 RepID=A0AAV2E8P8_9ROSI